MGLIKLSGCLVFLLFSCYTLLQAERLRRYLVGEQDASSEEEEGAAPSNPAPQQHEQSVWMTVVINFFLLVGTFLCYDLVVANILVLLLASDKFFLRASSRLLLCGMVGVLGAAAWYEIPHLMEGELLEMNNYWNWLQGDS